MNFKNFRNIFIIYFSFLGKIKRFIIALIDTLLPLKESYSQFQEDLIVSELLKDNLTNNGIYIDVGCNHPTKINNTYKLYRQGHKGICIDANTEFTNLYKIFRPRDVFLCIGAGFKPELKYFYKSKTPVISRFENDVQLVPNFLSKIELIPVFPLDEILKGFLIENIFLLSIDVEGMNIDVLKGAKNILNKTFILIIEFEDATEQKLILNELFYYNFRVVAETHCNIILLNNKFDLNSSKK